MHYTLRNTNTEINMMKSLLTLPHENKRSQHFLYQFHKLENVAHKNTCHYPLSNVLIKLRIEDCFLQPGQRSISIHQPALHENITVTFEVIAGRASLQCGHLLIEESGQALRTCTAASAGVHCVRWRKQSDSQNEDTTLSFLNDNSCCLLLY